MINPNLVTVQDKFSQKGHNPINSHMTRSSEVFNQKTLSSNVESLPIQTVIENKIKHLENKLKGNRITQ